MLSGFASNIVPGPVTATDETGQILAFLVSVSGATGTLSFDVAPVIDPVTGALSFTATADTYGTATIDLILQDNGSGESLNVNLSAAQQFSIEVTPVNDELVLASNVGLTLDQGSVAAITIAILETTDVDDTPANLLYTISAGPSHGTILVNGTPATQFSQQQINAGLVSYQNDSTANSTDSFEFAVDDGEGTASSGMFHVIIQPLLGDYNQDLLVDAADYVTWRKAVGTTGLPPHSGADGNGDTTVDDDDYEVWRTHFGQTLPASGAESEVGTMVALAVQAAPAGESTGQKTSLSLDMGFSSKSSESLDSRGAKQLVSRSESHLRDLAVSSPFATFRPANRGSASLRQAFVVSQRNEALLDWLESQPDTKKQFDDVGAPEMWHKDGASDADELHFESVEDVFAQLASS